MKVAIVILTWNDSKRTIRCLDSLASSDWKSRTTYVVDNGSTDGSPDVIEAWLSTALTGEVRRVQYDSATRTVVGGAHSARWDGDVIVVRVDRNLGYAAGNNLAIRMAVGDKADGVWILNNDTVVERHALGEMVEFARANPAAGMIGCCVLEDDGTETVQCLGGGSYDWRTSRSRLIGSGLPRARALERDLPSPDFVTGAALYLPRATVETVGLFDEAYFLFCEEMDLAERCRAAGSHMAVAPRAVVRHTFGATVGSRRRPEERSTVAAFHVARSSLLLTRKFRPRLVGMVLLARLALAASLLLRGRGRPGLAVVHGCLAGLTGSRGDGALGMAASIPSRPS